MLTWEEDGEAATPRAQAGRSRRSPATLAVTARRSGYMDGLRTPGAAPVIAPDVNSAPG
jgi:hypothetical protein